MRGHPAAVGFALGALLFITVGPVAAQAPAQEQAQTPSLEAKILSKIHETNEMEETVGKLAMQKGHAEKVRRYGERLRRDHQAADKKVAGLAKREGIVLVQPKPETEEEKEQAERQKQATQKLDELTGDGFDEAFLKLMEDGHEQKVQMLKTALPNLKNPRVHDLVEKLIPILQEHRDLAKHLHSGAST